MLKVVTENAATDVKSLAFMFYEDELEKQSHLNNGSDLIGLLRKIDDDISNDFFSYMNKFNISKKEFKEKDLMSIEKPSIPNFQQIIQTAKYEFDKRPQISEEQNFEKNLAWNHQNSDQFTQNYIDSQVHARKTSNVNIKEDDLLNLSQMGMSLLEVSDSNIYSNMYNKKSTFDSRKAFKDSLNTTNLLDENTCDLLNSSLSFQHQNLTNSDTGIANANNSLRSFKKELEEQYNLAAARGENQKPENFDGFGSMTSPVYQNTGNNVNASILNQQDMFYKKDKINKFGRNHFGGSTYQDKRGFRKRPILAEISENEDEDLGITS